MKNFGNSGLRPNLHPHRPTPNYSFPIPTRSQSPFLRSMHRPHCPLHSIPPIIFQRPPPMGHLLNNWIFPPNYHVIPVSPISVEVQNYKEFKMENSIDQQISIKSSNESLRNNDIQKGHKSFKGQKTSVNNNSNINTNFTGSSMVNNNKRLADTKSNQTQRSHPWLVTTLKGHTSDVKDFNFSSNGKYLASCAEDRKILIWSCSNIETTKNHKPFRINVEYGYGTKLSWIADEKAIAFHKSTENCIEVYKVERKNGQYVNASKTQTFPSLTTDDVIGFDVACTGRFLIICTNKTDLFICDLNGKILDKIETYLINNFCGKISPCGRFVAASGFASDCKVWEIKFNKNGEYQKYVRIFDLTGHSSGIYDLAFDQNSSHIATVSKDGTWKLFDINVEYEKGQLPKCIITGRYSKSGSWKLIALSLNGEVIAISEGSNIKLFSSLTGKREAIISTNWKTCGSFTVLKFDPFGKYLFCASDRYIHVFHNITGYKVSIEIAKNKLKTSNLSTATKERFQNTIKENEEFLKKFV